MNIFGIHFHNYEKIYKITNYKFLDEEVNELTPTDYRICKECGVAQEYFYDSQGGTWDDVPEIRTKILKSKIYRDDGNLMLNIKSPLPPER